MKARLMYRDRDFEVDRDLIPGAQDLAQDLELATLVAAMAGNDPVIAQVTPVALLCGDTEKDVILYRQEVISDCLRHPEVATDLYQIATEALEGERAIYRGLFSRSPSSRLSRSVQVLGLMVGMLRRVREVAESRADSVRSEGLANLFKMLRSELSDEYLAEIEGHLRQLKFRQGVLMSAKLGVGASGVDYVLRQPNPRKSGLLGRLTTRTPPHRTVTVADRDEAGARALGELRERGIEAVATAVGQSADHVEGFFSHLKTELAFYVGCINLQRRLEANGQRTCLPEPLPADDRPVFSASGLYDVCLSLQLGAPAVSNDVAADGKSLLMITGANRGGKSTMLRSIGLAQVMMQCGMPVAADSLRANVCRGVFSHYKREEDAKLQSGKFDEELRRMTGIIDHLEPSSLVLFNESFSSTNEREGSEIALQVLQALLEKRVKAVFVTHFYELAHRIYIQGRDDALFLRAERLEDGRRTFRLIEAGPLETSYGADLYDRIFGREPQATDATGR